MKKILSLICLVFISINTQAQEELDYQFQNEMYSKSLKELRLIRNEFFARQGYKFKGEELNKYFSQFDWYKGSLSIDEIELSPMNQLKVNFIKKVESQKKLNKSRIQTLELLSTLPNESMGSWDWSVEDRIEYAKKCTEVGYLINDNSGMMQKIFIDDNHLFVRVVDGVWELLVIPVREHRFFILTNDIVGGGNSFSAYSVYKNEISKLDTNIFPEKWEDNFKPSDKDCELSSSPFLFDFSIEGETISVKSWKDECQIKRELILKFNKEKFQYEIQN